MSQSDQATAVSPLTSVPAGFPDELQRLIFEIVARKNWVYASKLVLLDRRVHAW
jgi:hypothetical protein